MSDKLYSLILTKEEVAYLISLSITLKDRISKIPMKKYKEENLKYLNSILEKLDKVRK